MEKQCLTVSWEEYFKLCDNLVEQLKEHKITDIVAISRGGMIPSQYIAYKLNIKRIHNFGISTYSENDDQLEEGHVNIYQTISTNFNRKHHILIVDDIADSGRTILKCLNHGFQFSNVCSVGICTLHYKIKSVVIPDYFGQIVDNDKWVIYPYDL